MSLLDKRLLHGIFYIGPGISPRFPYQARQRSWRAYMGRGYGKCHVIIYLSHIYRWLFSSIDFYIAEKIFELTNCDIFQGLHRKHRQKMGISRGTERVKRLAFVQLAHIFVSSLVSKLYQTMSICTMTLESVCKIYPRRCHLNGNSYSSWRIHLS